MLPHLSLHLLLLLLLPSFHPPLSLPFLLLLLLLLFQPLIRRSLACRDLVDDVKLFHLRPDLRHQMQERRYRPRSGVEEFLVVMGGFGADQSPSDSVEMYDPRKHEWSELPSLPYRYRYVAACSIGTRVYVIGGFEVSCVRCWRKASTYLNDPQCNGDHD